MIQTKIKIKQQEILRLIFRFRFLNRIQIQTLLKHKHHNRINIWLKDLTQKEYIGRIYSTDFSEKNKPASYYLSLNGIRFLKSLDYSPEYLRKLNREKERLENFISKYLFLADICIDLQKQVDDKTKFAALTASDFADTKSKYNFLVSLLPDLVILKETMKAKNTTMKKYYFLQIFDINVPNYSVKKKLKDYLEFYFQNIWEDNTGESFPDLIIICTNKSQLISTKRLFKKLLEDYQSPEDFHVRLAMINDVKENGIISDSNRLEMV